MKECCLCTRTVYDEEEEYCIVCLHEMNQEPVQDTNRISEEEKAYRRSVL